MSPCSGYCKETTPVLKTCHNCVTSPLSSASISVFTCVSVFQKILVGYGLLRNKGAYGNIGIASADVECSRMSVYTGMSLASGLYAVRSNFCLKKLHRKRLPGQHHKKPVSPFRKIISEVTPRSLSSDPEYCLQPGKRRKLKFH